jgi:hypothetical protein
VAVLAKVGGANTTRGVTQEVSVPGLGALGASNDYVLHHNDPYHPTYHHGNAAALAGLPLIASDYITQFYGGGPIPVGERINFNDMSLINGGKFEAFLNAQFVASWQPAGGHAEHRVGRNCDVRNFNIPLDRRAALVTIMQLRSGNPPLDEGNHWHLRF